jgi:hypothetical protein
MISTLRSIDSLLNRFDELSKCHDKFITNFDTHFSDIKNPLRHVSRTEDEQQKSTENLLLVVNESDDQFGSSQTLEDFHRRIIKSRYLHRPPSYSSNDISLIHRVPSRSSSITQESISQITNPQLVVVLTPNKNIIESKVDLTTKNKPKVVPRNSPSARGIITAFTKETASRLSKPKRYNRLPDQKPSIKTVKQILKPYENIKKEASKCPTLPLINRIKTATIKPSSKKVIAMQTLRRNPVNNFSCPLVFVAPAPSIHLSFPIQPQQKTARFVNLPKIITTTKRSMPYLKT